MFSWSTNSFDKLLDKSTSHLLLEPDWNSVLQICDCIRQGDIQAKYAVTAIKKKLYSPNPHVVLYTLLVLESVVKNCGTHVHQEVAARSFMEELRELVKVTTNENVKNRLLELIQTWAYAFRSEPKYRAVQDTQNLLRMEGFKFQTLKESDAMFTSDQAPEWADGDCCNRCRVQFSVMQRKHHCRNCGQIFCNKCSSRCSAIPRFGIEKEVRVCEACWDKLNKTSPSTTSSSSQKSNGSSSEQSSPHVPSKEPNSKSEQEIQEEEELQLAIALSKSEAEKFKKQEASVKSIITSGDSELDHYLNRPYWEQKQSKKDEEPTIEIRNSPTPSAPVSISNSFNPSAVNPIKVSEKYQTEESDEMTEFLSNLRSTLEIFVNRMKSNYSRGRPITNDTYVQSLFMNTTSMHSQLLRYIQEQDASRAHFESLQDKLAQVRDAREALDSLREEHKDRLRREAEEAERQRQIMMAEKLNIMRKKKQEYLQYQRQLALQRMHEEEREMYLRQDQQNQYQHHSLQRMYSPPPAPSSYIPVQSPNTQGYPGIHPGSTSDVPQHSYPGQMQMKPPSHLPPQGPEYQPFSLQSLSAALPQVSQEPMYSHASTNSGIQVQSIVGHAVSAPPGSVMSHQPQMTTMQMVVPPNQSCQQPQNFIEPLIVLD